MLQYLHNLNMNKKLCCLSAFIISFLFMLALYKIYRYAPFGNQSLAWMDANIQYLDFFAFLKDVIHGKNNIRYSLSNTLGGTSFGVFSYYLASPLNLLVVFFEKEQLHSFFDLIVALKAAIAAAAMTYYLCIRFRIPVYILFCLSFSYSFGQYTFAQASNVMWLDGIYLLPVILAGVYQNVIGEGSRLLSISVAFSVIFNWYSGGINCLFSFFYFLCEFFLLPEQKTFSLFVKRSFRYAYATLIGLCLSAFLFLPSIALLRDGVGKGFDWNLLTNTFKGNILSVVQYYALGSVSSKDHVSLFCGSIPLLGCLLFNYNKDLDITKRVVLNVFLLFTVLMFYWQPLFFLFSLLKDASSYWFRYSYVGLFSMVFIAAHFYENLESGITTVNIIRPIGYFVIGLLLLNYDRSTTDLRYFCYTAIFLFLAYFCLKRLSSKDNTEHLTVCFTVFLLVITLVELGLNGKLLMKHYHYDNVNKFIDYERNTQILVDNIKKHDNSYYRVSQTSSRSTYAKGLPAQYNESLAFNYPSISSYTSCPDNLQMSFLDRIGYRTEFERIKVVHSSIIGADSLLGVKYILSKYPIRGLEELGKVGFSYDGKKTYVNRFALPMAFIYKNNELLDNCLAAPNPFEYQNALYGQLIGEPVKLYKPVDFSKKQQGNTLLYTLAVPSNEHVMYGNIPWNEKMEGEITRGKTRITSYSTWLSPSVFYIPVSEDEKEIQLNLKTRKGIQIREEQFYALDLKVLDEVSKRIRAGEIEDIDIKNGDIKCRVKATENEMLYLSVPFHKGWNVTKNGKTIKPKLFGKCLMLIPLDNGNNVIDMHYSVPYFKEGCIITVLCLILAIVCGTVRRSPRFFKKIDRSI